MIAFTVLELIAYGKYLYAIHLRLIADGLPLVGMVRLYAKSVGDCICCRPTNRGFSHCPITVGRQRRSPTLVYAIKALDHNPLGWLGQSKIITYPRGIYRCSILDCNKKFCENFDSSRTSADKRFSLCRSRPRPRTRGFRAVCATKLNTFF